jgi:D-alanine-D-alanine ligase-like ATP-grasp enzyme
MYIAVITNSELITEKKKFEDALEKRKEEDPEFKDDDIEVLKTESPLSALKYGLKSFDNQVEFLEANEKLLSLLQVGEFDLIINCTDKPSTQYKPAHYVALLELSKIPFCGSKMATIGNCKNKGLFKSLLRLNHIATAPFQKLKIQHGNIPKIKSSLKYPLVIKFFTEGIHEPNLPDKIARNKEELMEILEKHATKHEFSYILIEEFIRGEKYYLPILGNDLNENIRFLPMLQYTYPEAERLEDYIGKNLPKPKVEFVERTHPLVKRARDVATKAYQFFNCRDYAMAVFLQDERNKNLLLHELNPLTSLLPNGKLIQAANHIGMKYPEIINEIILYTLIRKEMKIRGKYNKLLKKIS